MKTALIVFCMLFLAKANHRDVKSGQNVRRFDFETRMWAKRGTAMSERTKKISQRGNGFKRRKFAGRSRKGRQLQTLSPIEDQIKAILRRVDLTGTIVEAIAAKFNIPIPGITIPPTPPVFPSNPGNFFLTA